MTLVNVNERQDIAAAVAAHSDLGPQYDEAVAEGLVERIGAEIDKRVDARLGARQAAGPPAPAPRRTGFGTVILSLGSMGLGVGVTAAVVHSETGSFAKVLIVALIWFVILGINAIANGATPRR